MIRLRTPRQAQPGLCWDELCGHEPPLDLERLARMAEADNWLHGMTPARTLRRLRTALWVVVALIILALAGVLAHVLMTWSS